MEGAEDQVWPPGVRWCSGTRSYGCLYPGSASSFPTEFGVHRAADVGRVSFDGDPDDADEWHTAFGGGIWISLLDRIWTLSVSVMSGDAMIAFYLKAGLHF